ncbi:MAG: LptF/LptG family permease [Bacteroidales bacterium]|nr:LptF/LptG family permease [Bacteroidales bacterium]
MIIFELEGSELKRTDEALFKHNYQMKNLSELSHSQDSLQKKLERKKENFVAGLNRSKYYRYERKITNYADTSQLIRDSIIRHIPPEKLKVIENLDSLYNSLNAGAKQRVLDMATEYAQNSLKLIQTTKKDLYERRKNIQKHKAAWHEKLTLSFACLIFFFIGAPLGAIIRKGGFGMPFLVSIIFFLTYYVITITGKKLAQEGTWEAWQGMWLSSAFTLPLGIFLTYKATTDSVLFDMDTYLEFIKRPFKVYDIKFKDPDLTFHKNISNLETYNFKEQINFVIEFSEAINKQLNKGISSFKQIYLWLLFKDFSDLIEFEKNYNNLYEYLSVKYRNNIFIKNVLTKLPEIEAAKYQITNKKKTANWIFLTILIVPVGLLVLFRSYLKLKVLKDKTNRIKKHLEEINDLI